MMQACRSCGSSLTCEVVDLGMTPISNAFVNPSSPEQAESFYPLRCFVCDACWLMQLQDFATPTAHFHGDYVYFASISATWLEHAERFATMAVPRFGLGPSSQVVEVASNDGYLLQYFKRQGIPCYGVDPAANCAEAAFKTHGLHTEVSFFNTETASRLRRKRGAADLMVANNVLAHVPDLNDFVAGFALLLAKTGTAVFEFPHVARLITETLFDTIYHEHYSYLSVLALEPLFARHGLVIVEVETLPTHGGSLRILVRHEGAGLDERSSVQTLLAQERHQKLDSRAPYKAFGERTKAQKRQLLRLLIGLKDEGAKIVAYGAPAKGNTLLNFCGIGRDILDFTVDRSIHKQGFLLPGTRIRVLSPEAIFEQKPDYVLILPWNLQTEIMQQLKSIREWSGRFIIPVPVPHVVSS